jgi:hypothetical protein
LVRPTEDLKFKVFTDHIYFSIWSSFSNTSINLIRETLNFIPMQSKHLQASPPISWDYLYK